MRAGKTLKITELYQHNGNAKMVPTKYWNIFSKNKIYITENFHDENISLQLKNI